MTMQVCNPSTKEEEQAGGAGIRAWDTSKNLSQQMKIRKLQKPVFAL